MDWEPIQASKDEVEAVEIDPQHPDLVLIKVPLSRKPEPEWRYFLENPKKIKEFTVPIHSQKIIGKTIRVKADRDYPIEAIKNVYKYIESANERYKKFLKRKKKQAEMQAEGESRFEKELKEITKNIRDID